jgi:hypothetical protein
VDVEEDRIDTLHGLNPVLQARASRKLATAWQPTSRISRTRRFRLIASKEAWAALLTQLQKDSGSATS